jgi:hypothetical protein
LGLTTDCNFFAKVVSKRCGIVKNFYFGNIEAHNVRRN